ncbi:MAG TPA: HAD-IA family hydrolase, partial [Candidatus Saccharimonadales bacterium]|nr:HAD-IA family hydrolase [Candidatus Saccharimonadales bacterium]
MYKAVIFDFFGVFCPDLSLEWFKTVPSYQAKLADFQAICTKSDYDKISREDFYKEVAVLANVPAAQAAQEIEANTAIDTELVQYVRSLRGKHYKTACLSNGTNEWTLRIITNYGLADLFDEIVLSGDIGIVKPNAGIYNETLRRLGVRPEEA